jgi:hypothetical protein
MSKCGKREEVTFVTRTWEKETGHGKRTSERDSQERLNAHSDRICLSTMICR